MKTVDITPHQMYFVNTWDIGFFIVSAAALDFNPLGFTGHFDVDIRWWA